MSARSVESLAQPIHWWVFKSMSTGFLLWFARGLNEITVHNTVPGTYLPFFPPSPCPCSTVRLKASLVSILDALDIPDNHPTQSTQFQKGTKFHFLGLKQAFICRAASSSAPQQSKICSHAQGRIAFFFENNEALQME